MKQIAIIFSIITIAGSCYASDYQGVEEQGTIFQKLGDFLTGKYEVEKDKTLEEKGIVQTVADQVKKIETSPVR